MHNIPLQFHKPTGSEYAAGFGFSSFGELLVANLTPSISVHFPYNINSEVIESIVTGSGTVTHADNMVVVSSGAASSSTGQILTKRVVEYNPGMGVDGRFTAVFSSGVAGNTQTAGLGNSEDGFMFGFNGTAFGILHRNGGVDTWIAQTSWNSDLMDGTGFSGITLDPTKGNVFRVSFQWLGFGSISFFIENPDTGIFVLVHIIKYSNSNTVPSLTNPTFPMCINSNNTSNTTDISIRSSSMAAFIQGTPNHSGDIHHSISNTKTLTTETNILTIRNKTTYQSVTNQVRVRADSVTMSADGNKNVLVKAYINTTLGGTPSFTDISTNTSVVDFDVAGTTVSGGVLVATFALAKGGNLSEVFEDVGFTLAPGDTMTWSATSSLSNDVTIALSWDERFR